MVSDAYYPHVGGISEHIFNLSHELRTLGHTVKILTTNYKKSKLISPEITPDESYVHRVGTAVIIHANKSFSPIPIGWRLSNKIEQFFQVEKFDVIHIHGVLAPMLPILALRHSQAINLITYHAGHPKNIIYIAFHNSLLPYHHRLHGHIAVSDAAYQSNLHYTRVNNYQIIPNAVNTTLFSPSVVPLPQFIDKRPKILFVGRFEPRKGLKYLLQALPIIKKTFPDILLIVVGEGLYGYGYREHINREVKNNIHYAGLITSDLRAQYYAASDVFCAPSTGNESFGIVLLEAMASGKPVVASNIPGYRSLVCDGIDGFLVSPRSPSQIAERIIKILTERKLAESMGEAGRKKALAYSWQSIARKVENYYLKLKSRYTKLL